MNPQWDWELGNPKLGLSCSRLRVPRAVICTARPSGERNIFAKSAIQKNEIWS